MRMIILHIRGERCCYQCDHSTALPIRAEGESYGEFCAEHERTCAWISSAESGLQRLGCGNCLWVGYAPRSRRFSWCRGCVRIVDPLLARGCRTGPTSGGKHSSRAVRSASVSAQKTEYLEFTPRGSARSCQDARGITLILKRRATRPASTPLWMSSSPKPRFRAIGRRRSRFG
jgi:hypothetical protein